MGNVAGERGREREEGKVSFLEGAGIEFLWSVQLNPWRHVHCCPSTLGHVILAVWCQFHMRGIVCGRIYWISVKSCVIFHSHSPVGQRFTSNHEVTSFLP